MMVYKNHSIVLLPLPLVPLFYIWFWPKKNTSFDLSKKNDGKENKVGFFCCCLGRNLGYTLPRLFGLFFLSFSTLQQQQFDWGFLLRFTKCKLMRV